MLRTFMACLEAILAELGVKQLVVAAVTPLKRMWQRAFGFAPLTVEEAAAVEDTLVSPDPETCVMMRKALGAQAAREDTLTGALASARRAVASALAQSAGKRAAGDAVRACACARVLYANEFEAVDAAWRSSRLLLCPGQPLPCPGGALLRQARKAQRGEAGDHPHRVCT